MATDKNPPRMTGGRFTALRHLLGLSIPEIASALRVAERTARAWGSGRDPIPYRVEEEMRALVTQQHDAAQRIIATGEAVVLPESGVAPGRPDGWSIGVAARVLTADYDREVRRWDEAPPAAAALEAVLEAAGIDAVLRCPRPGSATVQIPSYRVELRHRRTRQEIIDAADEGERDRLRESVDVWHEGDLAGRDVSEHRMGACWHGESWVEWVVYHASQIGDAWEPVRVLPYRDGGLVWPH